MRPVLLALPIALLASLASAQTSSDPLAGNADHPVAVTPSPDVRAVVEGLNHFGVDLYRNTTSGTQTDTMISPASVFTAFGLAYAGARGATAAELAKVLHYPLPSDRLHQAMGELLATMRFDGPGKSLSVSNALFVQRGMTMSPTYVSLVASRYAAGLRTVDYLADSEAARKVINRWVEVQTHDRIRDLLAPPHVTSDTRSVLVNTIHFKADWADRFDKAATREEDFTRIGAPKVKVRLMHATRRLRYAPGPAYRAVALPYRGGETEMVVILPNDAKGLQAIEVALTPTQLQSTMRRLDASVGRDVILSLPKFKIETGFDLTEPLQAMGLTISLSDAADFTGAKPATGTGPLDRPIKIGKIVHKVFVEVEEQGTEAAAATAIMQIIVTGSHGPPPPPPIIFRADHPFLFAIRDRRTGALLFLGRFTGEGSGVA